MIKMSTGLTANTQESQIEIYCQSINQKIQQLSSLLVEKLHNCYVEKTTDESFTKLIEAVGEINAVEVENINNIKPTPMPTIDNSNVSNFYTSLQKRIIYYMKLLAYFLVLKGVPRYEVNKQTDLKGLIELIDMVDVVKPSILEVQPVDKIQYYGTNIVVSYQLKDDDGVDITEGDITIQDSHGIVYDSVEAGKPLTITPLRISEKNNNEYEYETFTIVYNGTQKYSPSNTQTIQCKILPSKITLIIKIRNINTKSRYYNSKDTGYDSDEWNIDITAVNYQNQLLADIPIDIQINKSDDLYEDITDLQTDENGHLALTRTLNQAGNYTINFATDYEDTDKMSNVNVQYPLTIKYSIIQQAQNQYTDYTGKNNYTYSIDIVDEDTGIPTSRYDNYRVWIFLNDEQIDMVTVTNKQASYSFNQLAPGQKRINWVLMGTNITLEAVTYLNILSNFTLPEKQNYFLMTTPTILYKPEGASADTNTVNATISYISSVFNEDDIGDYILENITLNTDNTGVIQGIEQYDDPGDYEITLQSSNNLNETVSFKYKLTQPFDIERTEYDKSANVSYKITFYDSEDNYNIQVKNNNNIIDSSLYNTSFDTSTTYKTVIIDIPISESLIGTNTLSVTQNNYSQDNSFKFITKTFSLLTSTVSLGENTMQIQCYDENIDSIDIESDNIEVLDIEKVNDIFTVTAEFKKAGTIQFNAIGDDLTTEPFTINVTKHNLLPDIEYNIAVSSPQDERSVDNSIAIIDIPNSEVLFNIDNTIYSDLSIKYIIKQGNEQLHTQTFTYYQDIENNDFTLTIPQLPSGEYTIEFIYFGDENYINFNTEKSFTILKNTPQHNINDKYTAFKDTEFFVYHPQFTTENPADITMFERYPTGGYSTQEDGIWTVAQYYLTDGWYNTGTWECDFDLKTEDNSRLQYTGVGYLIALSPTTPAIERGGGQYSILGGWEGVVDNALPGSYTRTGADTLTIANGSPPYLTKIRDWVHFNIKKTSPTTLVITKTNDVANNGTVTYEWQELSNYEKFTFGVWNNKGTLWHKMQIKDFIVRGVY